jgi:hypothetical protein
VSIPDAAHDLVHDLVPRDDLDAVRHFGWEQDDFLQAVFPLAFRNEDGGDARKSNRKARLLFHK